MKTKGPWTSQQAEMFLVDTRVPLRLACIGAAGHPVLASLWFVPMGETLWCATQRKSAIATHLSRDSRCAFEVAGDTPPYQGVRGQGVARLHDDRAESVLCVLIERYGEDPGSPLARWLMSRLDSETAIAIEPETLVTWDYSDRMRAD